MKSRAPRPAHLRMRAAGGGRRHKAVIVRQELYEWYASIRFAIDWKRVIEENRSRGLKKNLARFPRSIMRVKVQQLLREHAHASILNGVRPQTFKPDSWWFQRWQEDYGLSLRQANRKFAVPRWILHERLQLFWVSLFRIRQLAVLDLGYEPMQLNFDQSPYHHNETGSQNKASLGVRGSTLPVVEGNSDCKSRWTANLTTCSDETAVAAGFIPWSETMFKATRDGTIHKRLEQHRVINAFPVWLTVSVSEKGSYREHDVIEFLKKHLEEWKPGRQWRILFADDMRAHKTENVWNLCWERGYILILHGGGATPVAQTPDTDLNEHVRRLYGNKEAALLMEKMRNGQSVPRCSHEECMDLMHSILSDKELHMKASQGYKKVGQSIDLHGKEDNLIVREAALYWNQETSDGYPTMRQKVDAEMAEVVEHFEGGLVSWTKHHVRRLICKYPAHKAVDTVIENLAEDFFHDEIHDLDAQEDEDDKLDADARDSECETAVAADKEDESDASSDGDDVTAVAAECDGLAADAIDDNACEEVVALDGHQAEAVHQNNVEIATLQGCIEAIKPTGQLKVVQHLERELVNLKRRQRSLCSETPAVADAFKRLRLAEAQQAHERMLAVTQTKALQKKAKAAIAEKNAAVAALAKTRKLHQKLESTRALAMADKMFTLDMLGADDSKAKGATGRKQRFEVLDRLSSQGAGLHPEQRNLFDWWKRQWDDAMVEEHKGKWAALFAGWMQNIMNSSESNAFSAFMHEETNRVLRSKFPFALKVPGGN